MGFGVVIGIPLRFGVRPSVTGVRIATVGVNRFLGAADDLAAKALLLSSTAATAIVKKPVAVYIEKVYEEGDFAGLGIGT